MAGRGIRGAVAALGLFACAAQAGDVHEQALAAERSGDYARARGIWASLANTGDARAQHALGRLHEKGLGVPADFAEALRWYRKAAEQGHADSQYRLAVAYAFGLEGVSKDERLAGGHRKAQRLLAQAYEKGQLGLKPDAAQARYWRERSGTKQAQTRP